MGKKSDIIKEYDEKRGRYELFANEIQHQLTRILNDSEIACADISCRTKDKGSLEEKIDRKKDKYNKIDDITDIAGVRVITYYINDVEKVATIIEREFEIDRVNSIDKGASLDPDRFGYCSVHYVVQMSKERLKLSENKIFDGMKCEIQIRSVLQHAWAEIEHDLGYKSERSVPKDVRRNFSRLAGLLEIADKEFKDIREQLTEYQTEISKKIEQNEYDNVEIDAIVLDELFKTDKNIQEICEAIVNAKEGISIDAKEREDYARTIAELNSLGIFDLKTLKSALEKNKKTTIKALNKVISTSERESIKYRKNVPFFFLCYGYMVDNDYTVEEIKKYFKDNSIAVRDKGFYQLLLDCKD